jgi:hypothetical protein
MWTRLETVDTMTMIAAPGVTMTTTGNSFSHFLKRIRQENDTHEMDSSESSQGESDHDAPSETDSDDESIGMPLERMYSRLKKIHSRPISPRSPYHNSMMARRKRPNWWH